jgi:hypothetical protein
MGYAEEALLQTAEREKAINAAIPVAESSGEK